MKRKINFRILTIVILTIVLIIMCVLYFKEDDNQISKNVKFDNSKISDLQEAENNVSTIVNTTTEISSGLVEKVELHATYYLEESYVEENQLVKAGENILKYSNGNYLTAPYDCVITEINIPSLGEKCTNNNYIQISSINTLKVQTNIDETNINSVAIGQEAKIKISAYDDKEFEGIITNISNTASGGKFTVTVEFENDGNIMLGMTAELII